MWKTDMLTKGVEGWNSRWGIRELSTFMQNNFIAIFIMNMDYYLFSSIQNHIKMHGCAKEEAEDMLASTWNENHTLLNDLPWLSIGMQLLCCLPH